MVPIVNYKKYIIISLLALSGCTGMDVDQKRPTIAKYHDAAWIKNDANAQHALGLMYSDGEEIETQNLAAAFQDSEWGVVNNTTRKPIKTLDKTAIDLEKAEYWLIKAAKQGLKEAQFKLATLYSEGQIQPKDARFGQVHWLSEAGKNNHSEAQYLLGTMYDDGEGVMENDEQALFWFTKAAKLNHVAAQYKVGIMHANNHGLPPSPWNEKAAIAWLQKAAEQNYRDAQFALGSMHENGNGTPRNIRQAAAWYKKAAAQGHSEADSTLNTAEQYIAAYTHQFVTAAKEDDYKEFLRKYEHDDIDGLIPTISGLLKSPDNQDYIAGRSAAAQKGNIQANLDIGKEHLTPLDIEGARKAIPFLETASSANSKEASVLLGVALFIADNKANQRLTTSAEEGDAQSQYLLGKAYEEGLGVEQKPYEARSWYEKSSQQGHPNAAIALNAISEKIVQREKELATQKAEQEKLEARLAAEQARKEKNQIHERVRNKENDLRFTCKARGNEFPFHMCLAEAQIKIRDRSGVRMASGLQELSQIGGYLSANTFIVPVEGKFTLAAIHTAKHFTLEVDLARPDGTVVHSEKAFAYEPIHMSR